VRDADQILVLERGEIVERGDHERLLESAACTRNLCQSGLFVDTDEQELIGENLEVGRTPSAPETNLLIDCSEKAIIELRITGAWFLLASSTTRLD